MFKPMIGRVAVVAALFALAACAPKRTVDPRLAQPLPPPGPSAQAFQPQGLQPPSVTQQAGAPQDIVLRGVAFAQRGDGRFPPNSRLTIRVFDADRGNVGNPIVQETYSGSGVLPWPYSLNFRTEALAGVRQAALVAQLEGPDGQLIYQSAQPVPLVPGGSEDIPMIAVGASSSSGGFSSGPSTARTDPFTGAPIERESITRYGIPDDRGIYGSPTFDAPVYPGQSYDPVSISGPPTNGVF